MEDEGICMNDGHEFTVAHIGIRGTGKSYCAIKLLDVYAEYFRFK